MIIDRLTDELRKQFPERRFVVDLKPSPKVVFTAAHPDVGPVEILDDGEELTLIAGNFTHGHFSCFDEKLSKDEKAVEIIEKVIDFLKALFDDQVVLWGSHAGGGGWYRLESEIKTGERIFSPCGKRFVWSGPLKNERSS